MKEIEEKECPKCKKGIINRYGIFRNEVTLNVNEDGSPEYFDDEVSEFRNINLAEEIFWKCDLCDYKKEIKGDENVELQN